MSRAPRTRPTPTRTPKLGRTEPDGATGTAPNDDPRRRGLLPPGAPEPEPRAVLYAAYARLLGFPPAGLAQAWADGTLWRELGSLHRAAGVPQPAPEPRPTGPAVDATALEAAYLATFEVGVPQPPVPLCESAYGTRGITAHRALLEELVRFYECFDLDLGSHLDELPDHLTVELEFLAAVAQMEAWARDRGADGAPFARARADFVERHLLPFVDAIRGRPLDWQPYRAVFASLRTALATDLARLRSL